MLSHFFFNHVDILMIYFPLFTVNNVPWRGGGYKFMRKQVLWCHQKYQKTRYYSKPICLESIKFLWFWILYIVYCRSFQIWNIVDSIFLLNNIGFWWYHKPNIVLFRTYKTPFSPILLYNTHTSLHVQKKCFILNTMISS